MQKWIRVVEIILCIIVLVIIANIINLLSNKDDYSVLRNDMSTKVTSENITPRLVIQSDIKNEIKDNYIYISGRVKNISQIDISYWKVTVEFIDINGNVLDTDYTNSLEIIRPNNQKEFEIMHKNNSEYSKFNVSVDEVR
jgi:hypothetical protein